MDTHVFIIVLCFWIWAGLMLSSMWSLQVTMKRILRRQTSSSREALGA